MLGVQLVPVGADAPGILERFSEPDQNYGVPCVPDLAVSAAPALVPLKGVDILDSLDLRFRFKTTWNAFTSAGGLVASPMWPYNFIQRIQVPYQTGNINALDCDGHMAWIYSVLRQNNRKYRIDPYAQQAPVQATGYSASSNLVSSATYDTTPSASTAYQYDFELNVPIALYFEHFFDQVTDDKGNMQIARFDETFVSPWLMGSTGRNSLPSIALNPVLGNTYDKAAYIYTGSGTTPTWTDGGSLVWMKRNGWRQPSNPAALPPMFNWARTVRQQRVALPTNSVQIQIPSYGQLLCIVGRMYDPTLNTGAGGMIPLSDLSNLNVQYGSGINKWNDSPEEHQERIFQQHGVNFTDGVIVFDAYADERSNKDALNTYNTAGVTLNLDFGGNTPGAGSYIDLGLEFLTLVQR